jgi:hypothetical protein
MAQPTRRKPQKFGALIVAYRVYDSGARVFSEGLETRAIFQAVPRSIFIPAVSRTVPVISIDDVRKKKTDLVRSQNVKLIGPVIGRDISGS